MGVTIVGLARVIDKLGPELISGPLDKFWKRIGVTIQSRAREHAPVDLGHLKNAIDYATDDSTPPLWARVGLLNASEGSPLWFKGRAMEYGTGKQGDPAVSHKSSHWPPGPALDVWANRHGFASGFQVAQIIGRRGGLKPRSYLRSGLKDSLSAIQKFIDQLGNDIQAIWSSR